ncbi:MAG TPA: hypothetical protein VGH94_04290 [Acidimicrobiales bacterium]|jgi:hypothetical protein
MSEPNGSGQSTPSGRRRQRNRRRRSVAFWQDLPEDDTPTTVVPAAEPTAAIRSLGTPPLPGQGAVADHYIAAVVQRAAGLATALAAASGILEMPSEE